MQVGRSRDIYSFIAFHPTCFPEKSFTVTELEQSNNINTFYLAQFSKTHIVYFHICNGAKLAVASVACATPLSLPRPEIIYINVLHYSAPPRTYLLRATPPLCPDWRH